MIPFKTIQLDKPRKLRLGLSAMVEFEQLTGEKIMDLDVSTIGMVTLANLLWVMLKQDDETLTLKDTTKLIDDNVKDISDAIQILTDVITMSYGEAEEDGDPKNAVKQASS